MVRHVTIKKFCDLTGYTPAAVYAKKSNGTWREGEVWRQAPDGRILIDLEGFDRWVESGAISSLPWQGRTLPSPTLPQLEGGSNPPPARTLRSPPRPQFEPPEPLRQRRLKTK